MFKYFCILLNLPIKYQNINTKEANIFNFSLKFLYELLIKLNNTKYAYKIWNILIDAKCVEKFNSISSKNLESLIYSYSLFLIHNFFDINFTLQIFDESFFLSLTQFKTNMKIKYVINITNIISEKINNIEANDTINEYCKKCLNIFGNESEGKYSPKTLKNFYLFLLRKISDEEKNNYINNLLNIEENENIEDIQFNLNALKILYTENTENSKLINNETKNKIISFFLRNYYSDKFDIDISFSYSIEEMTLNLILSLIKPEFIQNKLVPIKSSKAINILIEVHKNLQKLLKEKNILFNEDEEENNELYEELKSSYKNKYKTLIKEEYLKSTKSRIIVKFGLILLFLYLKHPEDFEDDINDIIGILEHNFDKEWMKVFTALCLNLLHKGSPIINDLVMNEYKKMSSFIGKDGFDVIVEYLRDAKITKNKKKFEEESNEMNLEEDEDI